MLVNCCTTKIPLRDKSVHCVPTSPPYFGLRSYDLPPQIWGGQAGCRHVWGEEAIKSTGRNDRDRLANGAGNGHGGGKPQNNIGKQTASTGQFCQLCNAWRGSLGNEPTMELYIQHMVEIGREVWRVLRDDGIFFLNLGDSYSSPNGRSSTGKSYGMGPASQLKHMDKHQNLGIKRNFELAAKQLMGIPWRVALALQDDGWYLRQDIIWSKAHSGDEREGAAMPYSGRDRFQTSHEYIFMLTKKPRYFFDYEAVKDATGARRSVWRVVPEQYGGAHFATWPKKLVAPMIKASTSQGGVCGECGSQFERVVEKTGHKNNREPAHCPNNSATKTDSTGWKPTMMATNKWQATCDCNAPTVPATVLDVFCGSGTTGEVAKQLDRKFIGLDLSMKYLLENALPRAEKKTSQASLAELPMFADLDPAGQTRRGKGE